MEEEKPPKIEYPCAYPIKVMGLHEEGFIDCIVDIVEQHDPMFTRETITFRESRNGKYLSVKVTITATGADHIQALFNDLKATGRVVMVL
jgi:putative lipoic acid-binding regulatory protein